MEGLFIGPFPRVGDRLNIKFEVPPAEKNHHPVGRDAAKDLEATDFVDLTSSDNCFICDMELGEKRYLLAQARTNASFTPIIAKLGSLMGDGYIIVVDEDDYICHNCMKLFNRLDTIEKKAHLIRVKALKCIQKKYLGKGKTISVLPRQTYNRLKEQI